MAKGTSREIIEAALAAEAGKLDGAHKGRHRFDPIQRTLVPGCNWTANLPATDSNPPLEEMRDILERVQSRYPLADFNWSG